MSGLLDRNASDQRLSKVPGGGSRMQWMTDGLARCSRVLVTVYVHLGGSLYVEAFPDSTGAGP